MNRIIQKITEIFQSKKHKLTDEDRQKALEIRQELANQRASLRQLQIEVEKAKLERYKRKLEKGDFSDIILQTLMSKMTNPINTNNSDMAGNWSNSQIVEKPPTIPESQLIAMWDAVPEQYKALAKKMDDNQLKHYIKQYQPSFDEATLNRAVLVARGR